MHLKRLLPNTRPPDEGWDYIEVEEMEDGVFNVSAVVHFAKHALFGRQSYRTRDETERAGIEWAEKQDAQIVYLVSLPRS